MILWVPLEWAMERSQQSFSQIAAGSKKRRVEPDKDEGDRATTSQSRELLFRQESRDRSLVTATDAALGRIQAGTFGECLNCGQDINAKRLEAIPWVRYCITCQELIDDGV